MAEHRFPPDMKPISDIGRIRPSYDQTIFRMMEAGCSWLDDHDGFAPSLVRKVYETEDGQRATVIAHWRSAIHGADAQSSDLLECMSRTCKELTGDEPSYNMMTVAALGVGLYRSEGFQVVIDCFRERAEELAKTALGAPPSPAA